MNAAQKLNELMRRVETTASELIHHAANYAPTGPEWGTAGLLTRARHYGDAMRALRNEGRNARRRKAQP